MKKLVSLALISASIGFGINGCQLSPSPAAMPKTSTPSHATPAATLPKAPTVPIPPPAATPSLEEGRPFLEEYPAWRMPELAVTDLSIEPERANPGDKVILYATVSNIGGGDTGSATLVFAVNGVEANRVSITPLRPSEATMERTIWTADRPGPHSVRVHLELGQGSVDWTSSNNFRVAMVRVSGEDVPKPELEFEEIDFDALQLIPGESYTIPVIVRNPGFAHIPDIPVTFYVDDERVSVDTIRSLGPGEREELRIPWPAVTPGEHLVSAQMDLPDEFPDARLQNIRSWYIVVPDRSVLYSTAEKDKWVSIGPRILDTGWVGRMNAIAFHPITPAILYAGGGWEDCGGRTCLISASGLWKTTNGGESWLPIGDKLPSMLIGAVAVDPEHPQVVYAATGHSVRGPRGAGIFKSTDGGQTWAMFASRMVAGGTARLVIRYPRPGEVMIYAGTDRGVLRYKSDSPYASTSSIPEWDVIKAGVVRDLVVHPTDHSIVYASMENDGLYRTTVGEFAKVETSPTNHDWTKLTQGLPPTISTRNGQWLTVDIYKSYPDILFAGITKPKPNISFALYWSPDSGDTWQPVKEYTGGELDEALYNPYVRIHPASPLPYLTVDFGGVNLYKWVGLPDTEGVPGTTLKVERVGYDMKALEFHPTISDIYFSLGDQGVFRCKVELAQSEFHHPQVIPGKKYFKSRDECVNRNHDLRVTQLYDFDVSRSDPNLIIGGTQDTGNILYEGNVDWRFLRVPGDGFIAGDGYYALIDPTKPEVMYAQFQSLDSTQRTADGGKTWNDAHKGLPRGYGDAGYMTHDPNHSNVLLAVGDQVYYTDDGGQSWTGVGPTDTRFWGSVTRVVIQPDRGNWIAGTSTGQLWIWYRRRAGSSWELLFERDRNPASVQSMAFSAADSETLYVTFVGGDESERIYRFEMDPVPPVNWAGTNITRNFPPDLIPRVIAGDPRDPFVAYVGTDRGVWRWERFWGNLNWRPYNDGLPLTTVVDLLPVPQTGVLLAATKGRGAWSVITGP